MEKITGDPDKIKNEEGDLPRFENKDSTSTSDFYRKIFWDNRELDELFNIGQTTRPRPLVKETSQERMERTLHELKSMVAELNNKVATRDDIVEQTNQLVQYLQETNKSLQKKLSFYVLRKRQMFLIKD